MEYLLDDYGQFLGIFRDEKTAKAAALKSMLEEIQDCAFTLSKEQRREWFKYTNDYGKVGY